MIGGLARYDLPVLDGGTIEETDDVLRVKALERRQPMPEHLVDALTRALCSNPSQRLRVEQATALRELYEVGGLFAPMRVGSGKTLVSLLAMTIAQAERAVLLVPASLRDKTRHEFLAYQREGWHVRLPHILSYEEMGRPSREHELLRRNPQLVIADEAHRLRNLHAAVTRRVARCVQLLNPKFVALSGTLITDRLLDWWHLALWALGRNAPVPVTHAEAVRWGQALDRNTDGMMRLDLGALKTIPGGYHEHARSVRGMVPTPGSDCKARIGIRQWTPDLPGHLVSLIREVEQTRTRPDGELLEDTEVSDCLMQLACGFWYTWDPLPPDWWLDPRREWNAYVRDVLERHLDGFDSPSQVVTWLDSRRATRCRMATALAHFVPMGHAENEATRLHSIGCDALAAWRAIKDKFTPNVVPVWVDDAPLRMVADAASRSQGLLVWVKYRAAGERLAQLGVPYYPGGSDPQQAEPGKSIALSIAAHGTGRNLQAWYKNLVLTPPANARMWEQLIGRTHRPGQLRDQVSVAVYTVIDYHRAVQSRIRTEAEAQSRASGFDMKLTLAEYEDA